MTADHTRLVDDLARALASEPNGLSCTALACLIHRRRSDVLAALRDDPRFARTGATNDARWQLTGRNGTGSDAWVDVSRRLDAIEARLRALERQNGSRATT